VKTSGTPVVLALLLVGCGYGATVEKRGITQQAEPLRILNRQIRIYDCAGVPAGSQSCQYMRFQVALDKPDAADPPEGKPKNMDRNPVALEDRPPIQSQGPVTDQKYDKAGKRLEEQKNEPTAGAPISVDKVRICAEERPETLKLRYDVRKYPSSEVTKHAQNMRRAQALPVRAQLQQRAFLSNVGLTPRWSVDAERVAATTVRVAQQSVDAGSPLTVLICEKKQVANLDLVLLDEHINKGATGDVYRLEVWRESDPGKNNTSVESLNTVAQYGLGSALTGIALIGLYIFFGATR
jgi:hypothetical protein